MPEVVSIQYLRGVAALMVVVFHAENMLFPGGAGFVFGRAGVDMFFVISGFVMWITTTNVGPGAFLRKRLVRIVPLYWVLTLVLPFVSLQGGLSFRMDESLGDLLRSLLFVAYVSQENPVRIEPILAPGWTLNLEMMFYLIMAASLTLRRSWQPMAIAVPLVAMVVAGRLFGTPGTVARFYGSAWMLDFLIGIGFGMMWLRGGLGRWSGIWAGLVVMAAGVWWLFRGGPMLGLPFGPGPAVIVLGVLLLEPALRRWPSGALRRIGDASYSIYLSHVTVVAACAAVVRRLPPEMPEGPILVSTVLACIGAGLFCYRYVERPLGRAAAFGMTRIDRGFVAARQG